MKRLHKILSFSLAFIMLIGTLPAISAVAAGPTGLSGSGTENDPYLIKSQADLEAVRTYVNVTTKGVNCHYKLAADIDMNGATWSESIGAKSSHHFKGTFDGAGHTISNFYLTAGGFFDYANGCTIKNLTLSNVSATFSAARSGIFVNKIYLTNETNFENCHVQGEIQVADSLTSNPWCGGFAGHFDKADTQEVAANITFNNCSTDVSFSGIKKNAVGGFIGADNGTTATNGASAKFINCDTLTTISSTGATITKVGGFIAQPSFSHTFSGCTSTLVIDGNANISTHIGGFVSNASVSQSFENCTAILNVNNNDLTNYVGGFIGYATATQSFSNCVSKGSITVANSINVGGFIGSSSVSNKTSTFTNCANLANITALCDAAGFIGNSQNTFVTFKGCYNAGTITALSEELSCVYIAHFIARATTNAYTRVTFDGCFVLNDIELSGGRIYALEVADGIPAAPINNHCLIAYGGDSRRFELDADVYGLNDSRFDVVSRGELFMKAARKEISCFNGLGDFVTVGAQDAMTKNSDGTYNVRLVGAISKDILDQEVGFDITITSGSKTVTTKSKATKVYKAIIENKTQVDAPDGYYFITLVLNNFNDISHSIDFSVYLDNNSDSITGILGTHKDAQTYDLGDKHSMLLYRGVTLNGYDKKCNDIVANGYVLHSTRTDENGNIFTTYHRSSDNVVKHAYWIKSSMEMRVVTGQNVSTSQLPVTSTDGNNNLYDHVLVHQLQSLNSQKYNGGLGMIIRLNDGRFIIIDGGNWSSDYTDNVNDIYTFLKDNANDKSNIVIAAWIFTHTHTDHSDAFLGFSQAYGKSSSITIERVLYNACDASPQNTFASLQTAAISNALTNNFTSAKRPVVIKPLTGQTYTFSKTTITILYTMSDFMPNTIWNQADADTTSAKNGNDNTQTMVFVVDLLSKSGKDDNLMITGDMTSYSCNEICARYGSSIASKYLQVSHHGFAIDPANNLYCRRNNSTIEFHTLVDPDVAFWPTTNILSKYDMALNRTQSAYERVTGLEVNVHLLSIVDQNIIASDALESRTIKVK